MKVVQQTFVISDLHLGGEQPNAEAPGDRGFRLCTNVGLLTQFVSALADRPSHEPRVELVINGDMVDFLAESHGSPERWLDFVSDSRAAAATFASIVDRDRGFFDALGRLLDRGHRLVILLGNHDIELSLPDVRHALGRALKLTGRHDFHFVYDGEAYVVGDALIEHGNRYDRWNVVDHGALRAVRSWQSRRQPDDGHAPRFQPPAGSRLVCEVINPIKASYRFIDLLKPETETIVPLLLALEPGYCTLLRRAAWFTAIAWRHRTAGPARPRMAGDIAAAGISAGPATWGGSLASTARKGFTQPGVSPVAQDPLTAVLERVMPGEAAGFLSRIDNAPSSDAARDAVGGDITSMRERIARGAGLVRLVAASRHDEIERRLPALLQAVRVLQSDRSFDSTCETYPEYLEAAQTLARDRFRFVLFGHTHLKRDLALPGGARYINSGCWADQIRLTSDVVSGLPSEALTALRDFVADLVAGRLANWISRQSTYVRLDVDEHGCVAAACLREYEAGAPIWD